MSIGLMEAAQLTRSGRLLEATALIQRVLRHGSATVGGVDIEPGSNESAGNRVIDGNFSEIAEPANDGLISTTNAAGNHLYRGFSPKIFLRSRRRVETPANIPGPETTIVDEPLGRFVKGHYANAAGARPYKLYIPATCKERPLFLVVMLHGCTQSPDDFANGTRMNALAEERKCLVLYPEQTRAANHSRCWNWFKRGDQLRDRGEPAILAGMTREIVSRYRIDPAKVYVAGLSAGGAMAAVMATAYPELYAAVGVHSGLACGSAHDLPSALAAMRGSQVGSSPNTGWKPLAAATPTIVFHGDRDKTVHPRNGDQVILQLLGQEGASTVNASTQHGQVPGGLAFTRTLHRDSSGRIVLEHWLVHRGGHAWFGGSPRGSYVDPKGPDATREMIRFFESTFGQKS